MSTLFHFDLDFTIDPKQCSSEQIDFLDKFFKDNPWADSAQCESIVKATGLTESIVKVRLTSQETIHH
jgi:hypothetical protein